MKRYDIDRLDNRDERALARLASVVEPLLWSWFRPVVRGLERIPAGAGLYVGNHNSAMLSPDSFIFGIALYRRLGADSVPYGLGHEIAISLPGFHQLLVPLGAVRATHENAHRLFAAGKKVLVYPGGDYDAMRSFFDRDRVIFGPRRGYIRLALSAEVPIIPVVAAGAHSTLLILHDGRRLARLLRLDRIFRLKVFPIALSVPWGLTVGPPPTHFPLPTRIFIEALEPVVFDRYGSEAAGDADYVEACHERVHSTMQQALTRLAAERHAASRRR